MGSLVREAPPLVPFAHCRLDRECVASRCSTPARTQPLRKSILDCVADDEVSGRLQHASHDLNPERRAIEVAFRRALALSRNAIAVPGNSKFVAVDLFCPMLRGKPKSQLLVFLTKNTTSPGLSGVAMTEIIGFVIGMGGRTNQQVR